MYKLQFIRRVSALLCGVFLQTSTVFASEVVHCISSDYRYQYCRASTGNHVSLDRQISKTRCRLGDNWGYDRHGVWVDRGCEANFRVAGSSRHDTYDRHSDKSKDWHHDRHKDDKDDGKSKVLAIGAGIAGLGLLAAIVANSLHQQEEVVSWAVDAFRGYDDYENVYLELTILPRGSVSGLAGNKQFSGNLEGNRLQAGRLRFSIT